LARTNVVAPAPAAADSDHVYHLFVVRTPERDALRDQLDARGVASAIHYPTPIHLQPAYAELGLGPGSLPVAERLASENCSLPIFPAIEDWQIAETVAAVESFEAAAAD
jgi:dTDP-4-amino-4,6-dideoxygalactose transaminase